MKVGDSTMKCKCIRNTVVYSAVHFWVDDTYDYHILNRNGDVRYGIFGCYGNVYLDSEGFNRHFIDIEEIRNDRLNKLLNEV